MATGPSHFDYPIMQTGRKNEQLGRLIFDVKFSQKIEFGVSIQNICFTLNDGLKSQLYNFNIKVKDGFNFYESEHSQDFVNPLFEKNHDEIGSVGDFSAFDSYPMQVIQNKWKRIIDWVGGLIEYWEAEKENQESNELAGDQRQIQKSRVELCLLPIE